MGYRSNHFARNLRSQKTKTIGVIVPRLNSYFMSSVIAGVENVANREGYNLIISQSSEQTLKEACSAKTMFNNRVDGLLVSLAYDTKDLQQFESFIRKNVPVIFFDRVMEHDRCTSILIDNHRSAYEVARHLIAQGCRHIVHITAPLQQNVYVDRLNGYKQALAEARIKFKEDDVIVGNLSMEAGAEAAEKILKMKERPDGVMVANDNCAVGCMLAVKKAGLKIPKEIAFAGFNNDPMSQVIEPNLTTVNYPGYEMGEVAARHLISTLNGDSHSQRTNTIILRSELVVRASSLRSR
jgi:LacI family transcriptional regulator